MDHIEVGEYWEANAEAWTVMSRRGYDRCRDLFNTPTFLRILPEIDGLQGLDIGCGEGGNTRLLAEHGATMHGIDIAPTFIKYATDAETENPQGITYQVANAAQLPFEDESFDFATAFMSFQDIADQSTAISEAFRILKPGGFFQFSIIHPCFQTPKWGWVLDEDGKRVSLTVGDYFRDGTCRMEEWTFGAAPKELQDEYPKFKTPYFEQTLSTWLNMLLATGFRLEHFAEPYPDDETLEKHPEKYDARIIAWFLIIRCRTP